MIEVGIVGLDTSHPEKFADIIDDRPDATVGAVWDGGDVRDGDHFASFCERYDAEGVADPEAMVDEVDAAMVLTVNWDTHRELAAPLLEAGVPTLIDKPIAGTLTDVRAIDELAASGDAALCGGSAVPFHPAVSALGDGEGDRSRSLYCAGYNDPFYYGVHLVDAARTVVDADWTRIEPANDAGLATTVTFEDGSTATLRFDGSDEDGAFGFLEVGERTRTALVDSTVEELQRMYDPYIAAFLAVARGERDERGRVTDAASLLLGVQACLDAGMEITPGSDELEAVDADGAAFLEEYAPYY